MAATQAGGRMTSARKYDVITLMGVAGLSGGPTEQRSMLRLITLVTARYNWTTGELTVGRREMARLWGVDERTVKREIARLKARGFLTLRRAGVRGRVSAYALDFAALRAACDWSRVGPDFAARLAAEVGGGGEGENVIPFPAAAPRVAPVAQPADASTPDAAPRSEWSRARRALQAVGEAAFARWIAPLERAGRRDGRVVVEAPSAYHADFVERTYLDAILRALREADPEVSSVRIRAKP
jgi:hypothetical protein